MNATLIRSAVSLLIFCIALGGYAWWYSAVRAESLSYTDLQTQIAQKTALTEQLKSTEGALKNLSDEENLVENYFVSGANIVTFIEDLERRGDAIGATVHVASVAPTPGRHDSLSLDLSISGSFSEVMKTIGAIEYAPYDITVSSVSVNGIQGQDQKGIESWNAGMTIVVGSLGDAASAAAHTP